MNAPETFKGFTGGHLEAAFEVSFTNESAMVPYRDAAGEPTREKVLSLAGLHPPFWRGEKRPQTLYGLETLALGGECAFITEGESCSWALRATFPTTPVLGVPGASSWKVEWAALLAEFPVIYLSFDPDKAGDELLESVWRTLPWARRIKLPPGLDTRDLIQIGGGVERYEALIAEADYIAGSTRFILESVKSEGAHEGI
jgi:hypothetical protein